MSMYYLLIICLLLFKCSAEKVKKVKVLEKQLESYFPCSVDLDCKQNSFCSGNTLEHKGLCVCNPGYIIEKNRTHFDCYKEAVEYADLCELDIQCQVTFGGYSECINRACICQNGTHFYKKFCYPTVKLGGICLEKESCILRTGELAFCDHGRCVCNYGYKPHSDIFGEECVPAVELGKKCNETKNCLDENSKCVGICRCKAGYITNSDETKCLKSVLNLGEDCDEDGQCESINHSYCKNGKCSCTRGYVNETNVCFKTAIGGQPCDSETICTSKLTTCKNGVCVCIHGTSEDGVTCTNVGVNTLKISVLSIITVIFCFILRT